MMKGEEESESEESEEERTVRTRSSLSSEGDALPIKNDPMASLGGFGRTHMALACVVNPNTLL